MLRAGLGIAAVVLAVGSFVLFAWCIARSSRKAEERAALIRRIQGHSADEDLS